MGQLNTSLEVSKIEALGVYQAATLDGYFEEAARDDIQYIFLLGQLRATQSIHASYGNNSTRRRVKRLRREIEELEERLVS